MVQTDAFVVTDTHAESPMVRQPISKQEYARRRFSSHGLVTRLLDQYCALIKAAHEGEGAIEKCSEEVFKHV